jgi:hypothetical protein
VFLSLLKDSTRRQIPADLGVYDIVLEELAVCRIVLIGPIPFLLLQRMKGTLLMWTSHRMTSIPVGYKIVILP